MLQTDRIAPPRRTDRMVNNSMDTSVACQEIFEDTYDTFTSDGQRFKRA